MSMTNYAEINYEKNMEILSHAIDFCERDLTHSDIIEVLKGDDDIHKQYSLIELKYVKNQEEANILVNNLTNNSGPVRETCSYKILDLITKQEFKPYFQTKEIINSFIKAITDINPTVSRSAVEIIKYVDNIEYLYNEIIKEIKNTLELIEIDAQNRSYVQNKKNFNLYWNLEALICISDSIEANNTLLEILKEISSSTDYPIREKVAELSKLMSLKNKDFEQIIKSLENDSNIYVLKYTK